MTRLHSLTNTASGVAGEAAVSAALLRAGFKVARPFWNDDEVDLVIFSLKSQQLIPIPIQTKSVQSKTVRDKKKHTQKPNTVVHPKGLKKKYIDLQPALCLAIYSPARDKIWFFAGPDKIKQAYEAWLKKRQKTGRPSPEWDKMPPDYEVPIYVDVSKDGDTEFDKKWLLDKVSPTGITQQIGSLADRLYARDQLKAVYNHLFAAEEAEEENDFTESDSDAQSNAT